MNSTEHGFVIRSFFVSDSNPLIKCKESGSTICSKAPVPAEAEVGVVVEAELVGCRS